MRVPCANTPDSTNSISTANHGAIEKPPSRPGSHTADAIAAAEVMLASAGFSVDYIALVDAETLGPPDPARPRRLLAAARIGSTRLIDNLAVEE